MTAMICIVDRLLALRLLPVGRVGGGLVHLRTQAAERPCLMGLPAAQFVLGKNGRKLNAIASLCRIQSMIRALEEGSLIACR
jgi:hypothetical protein